MTATAVSATVLPALPARSVLPLLIRTRASLNKAGPRRGESSGTIGRFLSVLGLLVGVGLHTANLPAGEPDRIFRAGAQAVDVSPTNFPVIINGGLFPVNAERVQDPLHARCLVLDGGQGRLGLCVVDTCLIPRELADAVKERVAQAVLEARPVAYWRMNELRGPTAHDATGHDHLARYEDGVVCYLPGPPSPAFSGDPGRNRAAHVAGGRCQAQLPNLPRSCTVELWFWNGLPNDARPVTGYLLARGTDGAGTEAKDLLALGGTENGPGRLIFACDSRDTNAVSVGRTTVSPKTWNHVALVREQSKVAVYLNGRAEPEITGQFEPGPLAQASRLFLGGRPDNAAGFEGKIDEVAFYDRALGPEEIARHFEIADLRASAVGTTGFRQGGESSELLALAAQEPSAAFTK